MMKTMAYMVVRYHGHDEDLRSETVGIFLDKRNADRFCEDCEEMTEKLIERDMVSYNTLSPFFKDLFLKAFSQDWSQYWGYSEWKFGVVEIEVMG